MGLPTGMKVLWLEREGKYLNEDTILEPKDRLILVVNKESDKRGADFMNKCFTKG